MLARTGSIRGASSLALVVAGLAASISLGACKKTAACEDATILLTIDFDPILRATAAALEVDVQIDGGLTKRNDPVTLPMAGTTLVLKVAFSNGAYPAGKTAKLTVSPVAHGAVIGKVETFEKTLAARCDVWPISLRDSADGGPDRGDGAMETSQDARGTAGSGAGAGGTGALGGGGAGGAAGAGGGGRAGSGGTAGGGGAAGSGAGGNVVTPPRIVAVSPVAGQTDAPPGSTMVAAVAATFSTAMDPATFTSATFVVRRGTTVVAGSLTVSGATVTFFPARPLVLAASHQVTIAASVKDLAGASTAVDYTWTFSIRDGIFGASRAASAIGPNCEGPVLGSNQAGDCVVLWTQTVDATHTKVYGARYTSAAGWLAPTLVDATDAQSGRPAVAMSDDGTAVAIFSNASAIVSSRFAVATGWGAPAPFGSSAAANLSVAMDASGRAIAAYEGAGLDARTFTPSTGWSAEQMLSAGAIFPQVALAAVGSGIASFNAFVAGGNEQVYVARYTGTAWLMADPVSAVGTGNFSAAAMDSSATPLVMWSENAQALSSRFVAGAWTAAAMVGPAPDSGEVIALSQEPTDTVVAAMTSLSSTQPGIVWANIESGGVWRTAKKLNVRDEPITGAAAVAMAPNGNAMVVWIQAGLVWVARQIEGTGWILSQSLPDGAATSIDAPRVRIDGSGRATIVFQRADTATTNHIRTIRFE